MLLLLAAHVHAQPSLSLHIWVTPMPRQHALASICVTIMAPCPSQAISWCSNKSWHCAHDSSSLCTRHCALVPSLRHPIYVDIVVAASICIIQVSLSAATCHGIMPMGHQAVSLHKALCHLVVSRVTHGAKVLHGPCQRANTFPLYLIPFYHISTVIC